MTPNEYLLDGERLDDLQCGFSVIQHPDRFCFGTDAVLLAHFANIKPGQRVLDLGTGSGVIPLLLCAHTRAAHITGLELQPEMAEMASRSVALNGLSERVSILQGDLRTFAPSEKPFDVLTCNPPYRPDHSGRQSDNDALRLARHEICCTLDDLAAAASRLLRFHGTLNLIHRADRFAELCAVLTSHHLSPKRVCTIHPKPNTAPNLILLEAMSYGAPGLRWLPPMVLHE